MSKNELNLAAAGNLINDKGISREVIQSNERKITERRGAHRQEEAPAEREDTHADLDDAEDDDAEGSNPDTGESDTTADDGGSEDDREHSEDDGAERGEADANPLDKEYEVKIDGETMKVPLKEIIQGYQRQEDYQRKTQAVAGYRRELQSTHTKVASQYAVKLQQTAGVVKHVRDVLIGDVNSQYMQELRVTNPQDWLVQRQAMADRIGQIDTVLGQVQQEQERHSAEFAEQQKRDQAGAVTQEIEALRKAIPDWDSKGKARLGTYLKNSGFTPEELATVYDSRQLIIAEKARLYDAFQADRKKGLQKQAKPVPRTTKGSGGDIRPKASKQNQAKQQFVQHKKVAKSSGNMRDAGRAIAALL